MLGRPMSTGEARNQRFGGGGIADLRPADEEQEQLPIHCDRPRLFRRSEEHTSELQSLMRISYAVFCLKKKSNINCQNEYKSCTSSSPQYTITHYITCVTSHLY